MLPILGSEKSTKRRWPQLSLLLPLLMMILAMIACDDTVPYAPRVTRVLADPDRAGTAYALVEGTPYIQNPNAESIQKVYQTTNYGETWIQKDSSADEINRIQKSPGAGSFYMDGDGNLLILQTGRMVWEYPKPVFRWFFTPDVHTRYFQFPPTTQGSVSVADPGVIYVEMGTEGVLVGPNPLSNTPSKHVWKLTQNGLTDISPLKTSIHDSSTIYLIILLALFIPPLPLLHSWLIAQCYRYLFPLNEHIKAYNRAFVVTAILSLCAGFAVFFWLTNDRYDYLPIVLGMAMLCAALSAGYAVYMARQRAFTDRFMRRIAIATALVALIVPLGVAGVWIFWPFIITAVTGFLIFRICLTRHLENAKAKITLWTIDRLAIEIVALYALSLLPIGLIISVFNSMRYTEKSPLFQLGLTLLELFLVVAVSGFVVWSYIRGRGRNVILKKRKREDSEGEIPTAIVFYGNGWWGSFVGYSVLWFIGSGILSLVVFYLQSIVYNWFNTLGIS